MHEILHSLRSFEDDKNTVVNIVEKTQSFYTNKSVVWRSKATPATAKFKERRREESRTLVELLNKYFLRSQFTLYFADMLHSSRFTFHAFTSIYNFVLGRKTDKLFLHDID